MKKNTKEIFNEFAINSGVGYVLLLGYFIFYRNIFSTSLLWLSIMIFMLLTSLYYMLLVLSFDAKLTRSFQISFIVGFIFSIIGIFIEKIFLG